MMEMRFNGCVPASEDRPMYFFLWQQVSDSRQPLPEEFGWKLTDETKAVAARLGHALAKNMASRERAGAGGGFKNCQRALARAGLG